MTGITRMNWVAMMTRIISNNNNNKTKCLHDHKGITVLQKLLV